VKSTLVNREEDCPKKQETSSQGKEGRYHSIPNGEKKKRKKKKHEEYKPNPFVKREPTLGTVEREAARVRNKIAKAGPD